jgi:DNA-binding ferritin-like protein (Dps family)
MTNRNKVLLVSSIILALLVIASVVVWQINGQSNGEKIPMVVFAVIILISVLSVFVVYFSKIQKRKYEKLLNQEYYEQYEIIKDAVANSQLSASTKKDIIEDILEILLSAQESGKNVREVIENTDMFANEIIQSFAMPFRLAMLNLYDSLIAFILMVVGASLLLWLEQTQQNFFTTELDISMTVFFLLVAFVLLPVTKIGARKRNPWIFIVPVAGGVLFVLMVELLRAFFYEVQAVQHFLDGTLRMVPNSMILLIYSLAIPLFLMLKRISRKYLLCGY